MVEPTPEPAAAPRLRILFAVRSLRGYLRFFEPVFALLVERGHSVHLVIEMLEPEQTHQRDWLAKMEQHENFTWEVNNLLRRDRWYKTAKAVRESLDYARVMGPEYEGRGYFRRRGERRSSRFIQRLLRPWFMRTRPALRAVRAILSVIDVAMPVGRDLRRFLRAQSPDVLVLSPHLPPGSLHSLYIKEAQAISVPVALCVASWDNLSSKQLIRAVPERTLVWNETQLREAVEIHGIPAGTVAVAGAPVFDYWLHWTPSSREDFCARAGLDPERPYILYVAGALAPAAQTEAGWVREWVEGLRASGDPLVRDAGVLVRPHPKRNPEWDEVDLEGFENVVVFPQGWLRMPLEDDLRRDYVDSIHHSAAVVGLNSTAMIEAAIAGRPVYTILVDEFHDSQLGVFHFEYLLEEHGGPVRAAHTAAEHHAQLAGAIAGRDAEATTRARRFVGEFVRPRGLDAPAAPVVADTIEEVAHRGRSEPLTEPAWARPLRVAIVFAVYLVRPREVRRGLSVRWARLRRLASAPSAD